MPRKSQRTPDDVVIVDDPLWFKDAVIYELHVRAFADSNGDGVGDFAGLVEKLDYLADLGVTALWILPFYPSPLRDDGYDIADYLTVNPSYGDLKDFRYFLKEAHKRDLRVITELVINHTSSEHPWFQRARRSKPGTKFRDFYVWSDTHERYQDARIIFQDFETSNWTWDPVAKAYYWHRFYSHQPDLNFENPDVQKAVFKVLDFWMAMGVDGMRLDAVPYLYEREGTNCENLPETHAFLKKLRSYIDDRYDGRMILAEANQWPEDAAAYFGDGDECHMNFHFPVMPRMFMSVQLESAFPIIDILEQTPTIPETCQWAVFLRNHDELTLEMVTDEDRDYMYRMYAEDRQARINLGIRRRLAPLLQVRRKIELLNGLLFSLPGTPVLYYGDEIGMGDNIVLGDRNGVRTPMQWSGDRNAGFSRANPQRLYLPVIIDPEYHYESVNVEAQQNNPSSLLWWMKRLIALRKEYSVFGRGDLQFLHPDNPKVLAFIRSYQDERVLVVANLSRFAQYVELDLSEYEGMTPIELFGRTEFPRVGELPYLLTLGPHDFHWFALEDLSEKHAEETQLPRLELSGDWQGLLASKSKSFFGRILPAWLGQRRWFRGKARKLKAVSTAGAHAVDMGEAGPVVLARVAVDYLEGPSETYFVAFAMADDALGATLEEQRPHAVIARVRYKAGKRRAEVREGILYDATGTDAFANAILKRFGRRRPGTDGDVLSSITYPGFAAAARDPSANLTPWVSNAEQSNTRVIYGDRLILKIYRTIEVGQNPDLELGRFLNQHQVPFVPELAGELQLGIGRGQVATIGALQAFVPNQGDAWELTLDNLSRYLEHAVTVHRDREIPSLGGVLYDRARAPVPDDTAEFIGSYLSLARLLGERTADMHMALASEPDDPAFAPEPFSQLHQRSLYQSIRARLRQNFTQLRGRIKQLEEAPAELAREILDRQGELDERLKHIYRDKIEAVRIRCHGDYHLGQVLFTGKDFVIIDFEGEPARSISERRFKRSPLRDVAGMLRSFDYARVSALRHERLRPADAELMAPWADLWFRWVSSAYLGAYLRRAEGAPFIPEEAQFRVLLDFFLFEKCVYELGYELAYRPSWVRIPLEGLLSLIEGDM